MEIPILPGWSEKHDSKSLVIRPRGSSDALMEIDTIPTSERAPDRSAATLKTWLAHWASLEPSRISIQEMPGLARPSAQLVFEPTEKRPSTYFVATFCTPQDQFLLGDHWPKNDGGEKLGKQIGWMRARIRPDPRLKRNGGLAA